MGAVLHAAVKNERERGHGADAEHVRQFMTDKTGIFLYYFKGSKLLFLGRVEYAYINFRRLEVGSYVCARDAYYGGKLGESVAQPA